MLEFFGNHFFWIPLTAAALFSVVVGFVTIEEAISKK